MILNFHQIQPELGWITIGSIKYIEQPVGAALFYAAGPDFWTSCPEVNQAMQSWKRESFQGYDFELRPNLGRSYERSGVPFGGLDLFPSWEQVRTLYSK